MLDIKVVRKNPEEIRKNLEKRKHAPYVEMFDELIKHDKKYRELLLELENLRAEHNKVSREVSVFKKAGDEKKAQVAMKRAKEIPERVKAAELEMQEAKTKTEMLLKRTPNMLHESVPYGKDDTQNVLLKTWGKPSKVTTPGHEEILNALNGLDMERGAKIAGARFYFLKNQFVLLDLAIQRMALDLLAQRGFTLLEVPHMMKRAPYEGVTDLADFEQVMYKIEGEDLYLIATSEHPMMAQHQDEIIEPEQLPIKYGGISTCYRKEAGAHGKDTKGIFRVHQFNKVEQVIICKPEDSWKLHEELLKNTEDLFQALEIPYRVVNICTGDIGIVASKKYDIEAWMPASQEYREVASCSNCTDYQANRLKIRTRVKKGSEDKIAVHSLNNTMVATSRAIVALVQNHLQKDGSIKIPKALQKYTGFTEIKKQ